MDTYTAFGSPVTTEEMVAVLRARADHLRAEGETYDRNDPQRIIRRAEACGCDDVADEIEMTS